MGFTLEDGTGLSSSNSYAAVATYATFLSDRGLTDSATDAAKQGRLVRATEYLDSLYRFVGTRLTSEQALEWPREGVYDERDEAVEGLPADLVAATCRIAYLLASVDLTPGPDETGSGSIVRKREKVGRLEEETQWTSGASVALKSDPFVMRLLRRWIVGAGTLLRA